MNIYKTEHPTIKRLVHIDCYRLQEACDLHALELEEWLGKSDTLILTEWPLKNMAKDTKRMHVKIMQKNNDDRQIVITEQAT